eukprot:9478294-Karenia_brevis.AAC.1
MVGQPSHSANTSLWRARAYISEEEYRFSKEAHKAANSAKHSWPMGGDRVSVWADAGNDDTALGGDSYNGFASAEQVDTAEGGGSNGVLRANIADGG